MNPEAELYLNSDGLLKLVVATGNLEFASVKNRMPNSVPPSIAMYIFCE